MSPGSEAEQPVGAATRLAPLPPLPPLLMLVVGIGVLAFGFVAAIGWMLREMLGRAAPAMLASAVAFGVGIAVMLRSRTRTARLAAAVLIAVACGGASYAAVESGRRHAELKLQVFAGRVGPRVVEPDSPQGRRMVGAMLASASASLAAITGLPLLGYLVVRPLKRREPQPDVAAV